MVEPGLSERLRRYSRSSGSMVGVSMAIAMVICIAVFIWLYVQIGPLLSDFIPQGSTEEDPALEQSGGVDMTPATSPVAGQTPSDPSDGENASGANGDQPPSGVGGDEPTPTGERGFDPSQEESPDEDLWHPTHQIREGPNVNFRSGPNTISQPQGALAPGTLLRFVGDEQPADGVTWMHFEVEDGTQGWIRDIDVIGYDDDSSGATE